MGDRTPLAGRAGLLVLMGLGGMAGGLNQAAAARYAEAFALDDAGLAAVFAVAGAGSALAGFASGILDRIGRRRVLLASATATGATAVATGLAPGIVSFVLAQLLLGAFAGLFVVAAGVVVAEELSIEARAGGQAWLGVAGQVGQGVAILTMGALAQVGLGQAWRPLWIGIGLVAIAVVPLLARRLRETARYSAAAASADGAARGRIGELFEPALRAQSLVVLLCGGMSSAVAFVLSLFLLYYPETALGMSPARVTAIVLVGGGLGLLGFPLGAALANRFGRRNAGLSFSIAFAIFGIGFYQLPGRLPLPATPLLGVLLAGMTISLAARLVCFRTALPELYPTRLRGTIQGLVIVASTAAVVLLLGIVSGLTRVFDSQAAALTAIGWWGIPGWLLFHRLTPETRGRELLE